MSELFRPITGEELELLGTVISDGPINYPAPEQFGPLRWYDKEMRCASRGCGSPTYCKLKGIPYCIMHSLKLMNELLVELEVEK